MKANVVAIQSAVYFWCIGSNLFPFVKAEPLPVTIPTTGRSQIAATPLPQTSVNQVELSSGQATITRHKASSTQQVTNQMPLGEKATIETSQSAESRVRISLESSDVLHIGPGSTVEVESLTAGQSIKLQRGQTVAYVMPAIEGRTVPLTIQLPQGTLSMKTGKLGVSVNGDESIVAVFDNVVTVSLPSQQVDIPMGQMVSLKQGKLTPTQLSPDLEARFNVQTSPEVPAVKAALAVFRSQNAASAKELFTQIQSAFPHNAVAAYYLGLIQLDEGQLADAIRNWKQYAKIDPDGARQKDVPRHLSLLVTQQIKDEVREAIASESKISKAPPEPNSIAVHPLRNKADPKYRAVGKGLTAMIISDIAKVPGIKVLEREKIQRLLDEIRLSETGLVDKATAVRSGRLLRAEKIIIGDYNLTSPKEKNHAE